MPTSYLENILGHDSDALLALREVPAFRDCSSDLLKLVFRYGKVVVLQEGQALTKEGEFDQWVYFIIRGRLAVYVDEEHVDTISSALVGERCVLGEPRRATLRATADGVTALGVDMSLLDALRDPSAVLQEPVALYMELLSIITSEVINRIVELEFNLIDFNYKYRAYTRAERFSEVLRELALGSYRDDREANFSVYRYLLRHEPVMFSRFVASDGYTLDTRALYREAVLSGDHERLYRVAEAVLAQRELEHTAASPTGNGSNGGGDAPYFYAFVNHLTGLIARHELMQHWGQDALPALESGIHKRMALDEHGQVDLSGLMDWLIAEYRFSAQDCIELLLVLIKESSEFMARMNGHIKTMMHELTQTRFAKDLHSAVQALGNNALEFYRDSTMDEMIPFFSKNILDVYLVQPFLERVHGAESGEWDAPAALSSQEREGLLGSLFD